MPNDNSVYVPPVVDDGNGVTPNTIVAVAVVVVGVYAAAATVAAAVLVVAAGIGGVTAAGVATTVG